MKIFSGLRILTMNACVLFAANLLALPVQAAAALDNKIETNVIFHDQGPVFDSALELDGKTVVTLKLRCSKNDLTAATINYREGDSPQLKTIRMAKEPTSASATGRYDYWHGSIPASATPKTYHFELKDGEQKVWYNARGASDTEPTEGDFFIVPNFKTPQWLKDGIMYQIFVDRFFNADKTNDVKDGQYDYAGSKPLVKAWGDSPVTPPGQSPAMTFYGGDLKGVIEKLPYIRETVGANIVYLNPIFQAPSNHKYDTTDYDKVDPAFGGKDTLVELSQSLHKEAAGKHGYLILDGVFNHTGDSHKWFGKYLQPGNSGAYQSQESPYKSFYTFYKWPDKYARFETVDSLPKLNFGSEQVKQAIYASPDALALKYLKAPFKIDGWRLDAPKYADKDGHYGSGNFNHSIWREFRKAVKGTRRDAAIIGELWDTAKTWTNRGDQWDSTTNFDGFTLPVSEWITGQHYANFKANISASQFDKWLRYTRANYPTNVQQALSNHLSNHDISRFAERAGGNTARINLALIFQMTYVGVPTIYYGDEYGMRGATDPDCRRTFDWNEISSPTVALTHKLAAIRNKYPALRTGSFITLKADDQSNVYAYGRMDKNNRLAVVLNNDSIAHEVQVPVQMLELADEMVLKEELSGKEAKVVHGMINVSVPAHSGAIFVH